MKPYILIFALLSTCGMAWAQDNAGSNNASVASEAVASPEMTVVNDVVAIVKEDGKYGIYDRMLNAYLVLPKYKTLTFERQKDTEYGPLLIFSFTDDEDTPGQIGVYEEEGFSIIL